MRSDRRAGSRELLEVRSARPIDFQQARKRRDANFGPAVERGALNRRTKHRFVERSECKGLLPGRGRPLGDRQRELADGVVAEQGSGVLPAKHGCGSFDNAGAPVGSQHGAQGFAAARFPKGRVGPRSGDVATQAVIGPGPKVAQRRDHVGGRGISRRRQGANRFRSHERLRIEPRRLGQRGDVRGIHGLARSADRFDPDRRVGAEERHRARALVSRTNESAGRHRAPKRFGIPKAVAGVGGIERMDLEPHERRLGARRVVDAHAIGKRAVQVRRAPTSVSYAIDRPAGRASHFPLRHGFCDDRRLRVGQRASTFELCNAHLKARPIAVACRAHGGRSRTTSPNQARHESEDRATNETEDDAETSSFAARHGRGRSRFRRWVLRGRVLSGVDVIVNPRARLLASGPLRERVIREAQRAGARVHETDDLDALADAVRIMARLGTSSIVLVGGDGSFMHGVTALSHAFGTAPLPPVAFAPAGTVCTLARNVNAGVRRADDIVRAVCKGELHSVKWPSLRVRDDRARDQVGFIFGGGLVQRFFEIYDASTRGLKAAASIATRVFAGSLVGSRWAHHVLEPVRCTLSVDGVPHPQERWSLFVASVMNDVGLHFQVTYRAREEMKRFHWVASGLGPRALGLQAPRVLAGKPLQGEPRIDTLTGSVRVDFHDADSGYVLDGELLRAESVTVEAGPVLDLLRPP